MQYEHHDADMSEPSTDDEMQEPELVLHVQQPAGGFTGPEPDQAPHLRSRNWIEWYTTFPRLHRTAPSSSTELSQSMATDGAFRTANGFTICSSFILLEEFYNMRNGSAVANEFIRLARFSRIPITWEKATGYRGLRINDTHYLRIRGNLARIFGVDNP